MGIRRKIRGSASRPRMCIAITGKQMYVQFVDDDNGVTLASASTLGKGRSKNVETAGVLGREAAEAALAEGVKLVVVDRGGHKFAGRVRAIVDSAVAAGLVIKTSDVGSGKKKSS